MWNELTKMDVLNTSTMNKIRNYKVSRMCIEMFNKLYNILYSLIINSTNILAAGLVVVSVIVVFVTYTSYTYIHNSMVI